MLPSLWRPDEEFHPFQHLRREIDRAFEGALGARPWSLARSRHDLEGFLPAVVVKENEEAVIVDAELPGLRPQDIQVYVEDDDLVIRGERRQEKEERTHTYLRAERSYGRFERRISLSTP